MERTIANYYDLSKMGKKAYTVRPEVGKWYKFDDLTAGSNSIVYGKVVEIINDKECLIEKSFTLPSYRPYAAAKWFDNLSYAVYEEK